MFDDSSHLFDEVNPALHNPEHLYFASSDEPGTIQKIAIAEVSGTCENFNGLCGGQFLVEMNDGTYVLLNYSRHLFSGNKPDADYVHYGFVVSPQNAADWLLRNGKALPPQLIDAIPDASHDFGTIEDSNGASAPVDDGNTLPISSMPQGPTSYFGATLEPIDLVEIAKPTKAPKASKRPKRSTAKGEACTKLVAALSAHHKFDDGPDQNDHPIGCRDLAKLADVSFAAASAFFKKAFGGHAQYQNACRKGKIAAQIKKQRGEYADITYGGNPDEHWSDDSESH